MRVSGEISLRVAIPSLLPIFSAAGGRVRLCVGYGEMAAKVTRT